MNRIQHFGHQFLEWVQIAGLFIVALATMLAIGHQIWTMWLAGLVTLADLLLLFIYLEVLAMVARTALDQTGARGAQVDLLEGQHLVSMRLPGSWCAPWATRCRCT